MESKEDLVLMYEQDKCNYSVTVSDANYSLEYVKNILSAKGLESEFDIKYLSFSDDMPMRNFTNDFYQEFFGTYYNSPLNLEVFIAGMMLDIDILSIEDTYMGEHDSDEIFAQEVTSDEYNLKGLPSYVIIDWELSSKEFMLDYKEHYGHYFFR